MADPGQRLRAGWAWFGHTPRIVFAADGEAAAALVPKIQTAIERYAWRNPGDYRVWPGPNSNTFIAAIMDAVPEMRATLAADGDRQGFPVRWKVVPPDAIRHCG